MKIKISPRISDFLVESSLLLFTLLVIALFGFVAFIGFLYPFPTYRYFPATVEYQNEVPIVVEDGGIVVDVLIKNDDTIKVDEPIVKLSNRSNRKQSQLLAYEIRKAKSQLAKSKRLQQLGSISPMVVQEQQIALNSLYVRQRQLRSKEVRAPYSGTVYFNTNPEDLLGTFVFTGQTIGYMYHSDKKVLKINTSTADFRRFKLNSEMKLFSRELDMKKKQMKGLLYQKTIDREKDELLLYGDVNVGYNDFTEYAPGSQINVGILVTNKSLFEAFFGYDLYATLAQKYDLSFMEKFDSFLKWVQE